MAWISYNKKNIEPIVTNHDIKVIKFVNVFDDVVMSRYYDFRYELGNPTPKIEIKCEPSNYSYIIREGYHSYKYCEISAKGFRNYMFIYLDYDRNSLTVPIYNDFCTIYECVIPKGTKYYVNDRHEVVSETIIIEKPMAYPILY